MEDSEKAGQGIARGVDYVHGVVLWRIYKLIIKIISIHYESGNIEEEKVMRRGNLMQETEERQTPP